MLMMPLETEDSRAKLAAISRSKSEHTIQLFMVCAGSLDIWFTMYTKLNTFQLGLKHFLKAIPMKSRKPDQRLFFKKCFSNLISSTWQVGLELHAVVFKPIFTLLSSLVKYFNPVFQKEKKTSLVFTDYRFSRVSLPPCFFFSRDKFSMNKAPKGTADTPAFYVPSLLNLGAEFISILNPSALKQKKKQP